MTGGQKYITKIKKRRKFVILGGGAVATLLALGTYVAGWSELAFLLPWTLIPAVAGFLCGWYGQDLRSGIESGGVPIATVTLLIVLGGLIHGPTAEGAPAFVLIGIYAVPSFVCGMLGYATGYGLVRFAGSDWW